MRVVKADDYQTWFIQEDDFSLLVDPWLDKKLNPHSSFFIQRSRDKPSSLSQEDLDNINAIIITAPFIDHLHLPSLKKFNKDIHIYTSRKIKKRLTKKGFCNVKSCINENPIEIGPLILTTYPAGFPYNWSSFCFFLENKRGKRLFHESHMVNLALLEKLNQKSDIALITVDSVKFLGLLKLSMGLDRALKTISLLEANKIMATGTNPNELKGLIKKLLMIQENEQNHLATEEVQLFLKREDEVII